MCDFVSWIEVQMRPHEKPIIMFTTNKDLRSRAAKDLRAEYGLRTNENAECGFLRDMAGHSFIRRIRINGKIEVWSTRERENNRFRHPSVYPREVVDALMNGDMTKIGSCEAMLVSEARKKVEEQVADKTLEFRKRSDEFECDNSFPMDQQKRQVWYEKRNALRDAYRTEKMKAERRISWQLFFADDKNVRPVWRAELVRCRAEKAKAIHA